MFKKKDLPSSLKEIIETISDYSKNLGLDPFTTIFEMVDYKQINQIIISFYIFCHKPKIKPLKFGIVNFYNFY